MSEPGSVVIGLAGSTGFVGSAIMRAAAEQGIVLRCLPRVPTVKPKPDETLESAALRAITSSPQLATSLEQSLEGVTCVINAAGCAEPDSAQVARLRAINGVLPLVLGSLASQRDVKRMIHISSAAVQGDLPILDETRRYAPFSAYSDSKAEAEKAVLLTSLALPAELTIYRPTSVHGPGRETTARLARRARTKLLPVLGDGSAHLPLAFIDNVGELALHLATCLESPGIVLHPWEGMTQQKLVKTFGSGDTRLLPLPSLFWKALAGGTSLIGWVYPGLAGPSRRLQLFAKGQPIKAEAAMLTGYSPAQNLVAGLQAMSSSQLPSSRPDHLDTGYEQMMRSRSRRRQAMRLIQRSGAPRIVASLLNRRLGPHIRVINYHDITPENAPNFETQIRHLAKRFVPVGFQELHDFLAGRNHGRYQDQPGLIITFDDGFESHASIAGPVLSRYNFPGWFFIPTNAPDSTPCQQERWAKDHGVVAEATNFDGRSVFASWDQIRDLAKDHIIGSHTVSHQRLGIDIDPILVTTEVQDSATRLVSELGQACKTFCWVGGEVEAYSENGRQAVAANGYDFAFRTSSLPVTADTDPLAIERTNIEADYSLAEIDFQLSGLTDLRYAPKRRRVQEQMRQPHA